ncbi:MAG: thiamine/thiamine pyrophosphate ABC transporter permease [Rhizobiaceae bacterium]|nr:thiamine/thiamine pyrophosphate ABC transporter permease [Rhizobiaceae bacterium]
MEQRISAGRLAIRDLRVVAGGVALAIIVLLVGGAFAGLAVEGIRDFENALAAFDSYLARIVWFTLWQAILSTAFSVIPAIAVARALSRHRAFRGRGLILKLFALPLALPAIVATLGILALLGRAGLLAGPLSSLLGGTWPGIYGLSGILVAHVFFNLPLATRLLLEALDTVPQDQWRLASQLGMGPGSTFRLIEWPAIRSALPGAAGLVFMLCVTSFTVVLTLGGGPAATTLEVAIYQSLRFDFDPTRAVTLTVLQIGLTVAVMIVLGLLGARTALDGSLSVAPRKFLAIGPVESAVNSVVILIALALVAGPIAAVLVSGLKADLARLVLDPAVHAATTTSVVLAVLSSSLSVAMALSLVAARRAVSARRGWLARSFGWIAGTGAGFVLVVPPIVIGAGWFIMLRHTGLVFAAAPVMVVMVNAAMAMPFAIRAIRPAYEAAGERNDRLCAQLGISGWNRARLIDWPALRLALATGLAFSMALSLGDLGVIALFGSDSVQTLPFLLLARIGSYRTDDAAGLALLLGLLCLTLIFLADRLGTRGTP